MAGTANMHFRGFTNRYGSGPHHIPVRDADAPHLTPQPLSAFMIDAKYLPKRVSASRFELPWMARSRVPPLTSLHQAQNWSMRPEVVEHAAARRLTSPSDWRRVAFPTAAIMFIISLGIINQTLTTTTTRKPQFTGSSQPMKNGQTAQSPAPSSGTSGNVAQNSASSGTTTLPVGGRGGGDTGTANQTGPTASPATPGAAAPTASSGTTAQPSSPESTATTSPAAGLPVGGRGGGDGTDSSAIDTQPTVLLPMSGK